MTIKLKSQVARRRIRHNVDATKQAQKNFECFCVEELGFDSGWDLNDPSAPWHEFGKRVYNLFPCAQQLEEKTKERVPFERKCEIYSRVQFYMDWSRHREESDSDHVPLKLMSAQQDIANRMGLSFHQVRYAYEDIQNKEKAAPWLFYSCAKKTGKNPAWYKGCSKDEKES